MKSKTFRVASSLTVAGMILLAGCNNGNGMYGNSTSTAPTNTTPNTVAITNYTYGPSSMTVAKGTVVTWRNNDAVGHSATSDAGTWDTGIIAPGGSATVKFDSSGTFAYHCSVHPMMKASVTVQ